MDISLNDEFFYRISNEEDINEICQKFNTCSQNITRNNNSIDLYEGEMIKIKVNDFLIHYVKPMENLQTIAQFYGTTKEKLISDNNLTCEKLFIGQSIKIFKN